MHRKKVFLAMSQQTEISFDQKAARSTAMTSAQPKPCSLQKDTGKYLFPPWLAGMCSWGFLSYTRRILFHWSRGLGVEREGVWKLMFTELPQCSVLSEIVLFHPHNNPWRWVLLFPIYRQGNHAHSGVATMLRSQQPAPEGVRGRGIVKVWEREIHISPLRKSFLWLENFKHRLWGIYLIFVVKKYFAVFVIFL